MIGKCFENTTKMSIYKKYKRKKYLFHKYMQDNLSFNFYLMARTNKRGIAAKKAQKAKQAGRMKWLKRFNYPKRKLGIAEAKECGAVWAQTNPKGNTYNWFLKGRKVCRETRLRVDPDGYRYIKTPSGGSTFVEVPISGWLRKKLHKSLSGY